ncbi:ARL14 effector protein [Arctopsyche grandis]|uniref:ARL14 effector protein n=1 Tax=Arctopsyche grandis TaxID=121162 RepID=UPI00406D7D69
MEKRRRETLKFLENFDPEKSVREKRKLTRKVYTVGRKHNRLYDNKGLIAGKDICDCTDPSCPGCHFPCPKCSSTKCGPDCRVNRKWPYEKVEVEGTAPN